MSKKSNDPIFPLEKNIYKLFNEKQNFDDSKKEIEYGKISKKQKEEGKLYFPS